MWGIMRKSYRIEKDKCMMRSPWGIMSTNSSLPLHTHILSMLSHCLLDSIVSDEKLVINLPGVPLNMMIHFSLTAFKMFSLSLVFDFVIMMHIGMNLSVLSYLEFEKNNGWKLPNLMKTITWPESSPNIFSPYFSLSSFLWYSLYTYIGMLMMSHISTRLFMFFRSLFSLFFRLCTHSWSNVKLTDSFFCHLKSTFEPFLVNFSFWL